jgi:hypothetical protein
MSLAPTSAVARVVAVRTRLSATRDRFDSAVDRLVDDVFVPHGTRVALAAYAFVFGYYGFLKLQAAVTGLSTPVRGEVGHFVTALGLPSLGVGVGVAMLGIGLYEVALGVLFATRRLRLAVPVFLAHQAVTFVSLVVAREFYFQEPFLFGVPWLFDAFAAYVLKNTIFVGGFLVLVSVELGDREVESATE